MAWKALLFLIVPIALGAYQPGTPGAPWTEEKALIVKAKLYAIIGANGDTTSKEYLALHPELGYTTWPENKSKPGAAKFLR